MLTGALGVEGTDGEVCVSVTAGNDSAAGGPPVSVGLGMALS